MGGHDFACGSKGISLTRNSANGISVFNSGTALLEKDTEISSNAADGVFVEDGTVSGATGVWILRKVNGQEILDSYGSNSRSEAHRAP